MISKLLGSEILELYDNDNRYKNLNKKLPNSPSIALEAIKYKYGVFPSKSGHNISAITEYRNTLYEIDKCEIYANALMITAAHTHWNENLPIIIEEHNSRYYIGIKKPELDAYYYPVSFLIFEDVLLAYEWASTSLNLNENDLKKCIDIISRVSITLNNKCELLGISINYRFKTIFDEKLVPNIENPTDEKILNFKEVSTIEIMDFERPKGIIDDNITSEQVSWNFYSDNALNFNNNELEILNLIRSFNK